MHLYDSLFRSEQVSLLLSDTNFLQQMLKVEIALANGQAENGVIKKEDADAIATVCRLENIDIEKLKTRLPLGGNAAIPLIEQLRTQLVQTNKEAATYLHYGATSQDIVDTALLLQIKAYGEWLLSSITHLEKALMYQIKAHVNTVMIGRTLLQHAKPITFGYKVSGWLAAIQRDAKRIESVLQNTLKIQLGGPVGNGNPRINADVCASFAKNLGLRTGISWHTQRDTLAEWGSTLGILNGNLGKVAKDISLLMQTEVAEVFEGAANGKGGSSSMPHKRNPVTCVAILANANRTPFLVANILAALPQEHERAAGGWHAEWEPLNSLMALTAGSLEKSIGLIQNLEVDVVKMRSNIELTNGLVYAENVLAVLSTQMDYQSAQSQLAKASEKCLKENKHLKEVMEQMNLGLTDFDKLFETNELVAHYTNAIHTIIKEYEDKL